MSFAETGCTPHCKSCATTTGKCDSGECEDRYVLDSNTGHCDG